MRTPWRLCGRAPRLAPSKTDRFCFYLRALQCCALLQRGRSPLSVELQTGFQSPARFDASVTDESGWRMGTDVSLTVQCNKPGERDWNGRCGSPSSESSLKSSCDYRCAWPGRFRAHGNARTELTACRRSCKLVHVAAGVCKADEHRWPQPFHQLSPLRSIRHAPTHISAP